MGMIKNLWRGFRGGPDFTEVNHLNASLENIQFSVELPYSNIITEEPPRPIHFPFLNEGWFEENAKSLKHYHYVNVDTQAWYYVPAVVSLPNGELGSLWLSTRIKRIPDEKNISAFDLNKLGEHLIDEYESFYNAPLDNGDRGAFKGKNTKIRQDVIAFGTSKDRTEPWSQEQIERETNLRLANYGYAPLEAHKIKTINGRPWVFYEEHTSIHTLSKNKIYCMPLSEKFYLAMDFGYKVGPGDKFKLWKDHAEAAEKRIMESVKLIIPNDELALTHQA